jgi:hypothetical protein
MVQHKNLCKNLRFWIVLLGVGGNAGFEYELNKGNLFFNFGYSYGVYQGVHKSLVNDYNVQSIYYHIGYYFKL